MLKTLASTKVVFFYSGRIRTLDAMATYSSHRLIMGKWKLTVSAVSLEIFDLFSQICLLSSPPCGIRLLTKSLNLIG